MLTELLKQISIVAISLGEQCFSDEVLQAGWLGRKPASEQEIRAAEDRLGIHFPEDYRHFLATTNGFLTPRDSTEPSFDKIEEVGYLKDLDSELIDIWSEHAELQDVTVQLARSIRIGNDEQIFLLIPPLTGNDSWKYWKFASWIPGEVEYTGLDSYFEEVLAFLKN